ncbi:MAG TPA: DEAD/DEAH box helicase [Streptosporangiaceae bacterium]|jgi:superfamily II DNA/RNA helicase|nr:DEAD/DEAH box helicase [Streptosporangiaceae bacterium]
MPEDSDAPGSHRPPRQPEPDPISFRDLSVAGDICAALEDIGIKTAFPIQALALPVGLAGNDIIGQARTGTGKTLAFGIPVLQQLAHGGARPQALIVVPTRELAIQVAGDLRIAGARLGTRVLTVYGGRAYEPQIESLRTGVDVVVGTPGRLLDLTGQHHLDLSGVRALVLDEADRMLDLGFLPDVERILKLVPEQRQTMLFSATMPPEVVTLARRHLNRPMHIRAEGSDEPEHAPEVEQHVFRIHHLDKIEVLARVLQAGERGLTMVFCQTKRAADQVAGDLTTRGFAVASVHGDLGQGQRERALRAFRNGKVDVLVATDVAARGLDVDDVTHVVNYECPEDEKAYLHRTGRTGRAGRTGIAVTFVDWRDLHRWKLIDEALGLGCAEPPEMYSTSPELLNALRIPQTVTGTLPKAQRERAGLAAEAIEDIGETGRARTPRAKSRTRQRGRTRSQGATAQEPAATDSPAARQARVRRRTRRGEDVSRGQQHGHDQYQQRSSHRQRAS